LVRLSKQTLTGSEIRPGFNQSSPTAVGLDGLETLSAAGLDASAPLFGAALVGAGLASAPAGFGALSDACLGDPPSADFAGGVSLLFGASAFFGASLIGVTVAGAAGFEPPPASVVLPPAALSPPA
jgi:hypothetical protein